MNCIALIPPLLFALTSLTFSATAPSAVLLKDINPGTGSSSPSGGVYVNGNYYFTANDGTHGVELWKSDGTTAGTIMVSDINPGSSSSYPSQLTAFGIYLIFTANDGVHGTEVWRTDGTTAGTIMLKDINPGSTSSNPQSLCVYPAPTDIYETASVYFMANSSTSYQLWKTDGTTTGTVLVATTPISSVNALVPAMGYLFLNGYDSNGNTLFINDGESNTLTALSNLQIYNIQACGNGVAMAVSNSISDFGYEPWYADGVAAHTGMLLDIWPGPNNSEPSNGPLHWTKSGNYTYFTQADGTTGTNLWRTDGTTANTVKLLQISTDPNGYYGYAPIDNNGTLYFVAYDSANGNQLWKTDGSTTTRITSLSPDLSNASADSYMVAVGGMVYFTRPSDTSLWQSDGTTAGTAQIALPTGFQYPNPLASSGPRLFLLGTDSTHGSELWTLSYLPPTVATAAAASPNPTPGTTTALSVLGADSEGESTLTYTWSTTGTPPAGVTFSDNGTNSAKNTQVLFTKAGVYNFKCQIVDSFGLTVSSSVTVTVSQTLSALVVSATPTTLHQHQQFTSTGLDQFHQPMSTQPTVTWSVSGGGTINSTGYFASNGGYGGPYTVTAKNGTISGTAQLTTTTTALIVVSGGNIAWNSNTISYSITISGSGGSNTITLSNGSHFSGGSGTATQASQSTVSYVVSQPGNGSPVTVSVNGATAVNTPNYSVSIAAFVRPGATASSIPLLGVATTTVTISPSPLPAGSSITFKVVPATTGGYWGSATFTSPNVLTASGTLSVAGRTSSDPKQQLMIIPTDTVTGSFLPNGPPFSVCAHLQTMANNSILQDFNNVPIPYFPQTRSSNYYGYYIQAIFTGDNANQTPADFTQMKYIEQIGPPATYPNPPFSPATAMTQPTYYPIGVVGGNMVFQDVNARPASTIVNYQLLSGTYTYTNKQLMLCQCARCGSTGILIPNSGFNINDNVYVNYSTHTITTVRDPAGVTVGNYTAQKGGTVVLTSQTHNLP